MALDAFFFANCWRCSNALVIGFTGLLRGWWDHCLSQNDRDYI